MAGGHWTFPKSVGNFSLGSDKFWHFVAHGMGSFYISNLSCNGWAFIFSIPHSPSLPARVAGSFLLFSFFNMHTWQFLAGVSPASQALSSIKCSPPSPIQWNLWPFPPGQAFAWHAKKSTKISLPASHSSDILLYPTPTLPPSIIFSLTILTLCFLLQTLSLGTDFWSWHSSLWYVWLFLSQQPTNTIFASHWLHWHRTKY